MNDTIKELAKEAGFVLWEDDPSNIDNEIIDWASSYDEELVKFAELIVKRCSRIAMTAHASYSFESYDNLCDYERGSDDTSSFISSSILNLLR